MLLEYNAIKAEGGKVARVYARLKDTEDWLPVGNVSEDRHPTTQKQRNINDTCSKPTNQDIGWLQVRTAPLQQSLPTWMRDICRNLRTFFAALFLRVI